MGVVLVRAVSRLMELGFVVVVVKGSWVGLGCVFFYGALLGKRGGRKGDGAVGIYPFFRICPSRQR